MYQLKTLLVPVDGSELSERVLPVAMDLAQRHGSGLVLVRAAEAHVLPGVDPTERQLSVINDAERYLQALVDEYSLDPDGVELAVPYGPTASSILLEIGLRDADLVIMTTHGLDGLGSLVIGSVTASVLHDAPTAILVVPVRAPAEFRLPRELNVVVALDGSELAGTVVPDAMSLIGDAPARVTLVRAIPGEGGDGSDEREAREDLAIMKSQLMTDRIGVGVRVSRGEPAAVLIDSARELQASVIAIATHGRSGLSRFLMGSVAERVIGSSPVPVLIRRPNPAELHEVPTTVELPIFQIA
jgi:nucleotide-binding universal stress UspA family protein